MSIVIKLTPFEINAVQSWYVYVKNHTISYGGFNPQFPLEQELVLKLELHGDEAATFNETEAEIMCGWMHRAVFGRYGSNDELFGYERRTFLKLKTVEELVLQKTGYAFS